MTAKTPRPISAQETMPPILIRQATAKDSQDIWAWRNDAHTRAMSVATGLIPWDTHQHWFEQLLLDPNRYLYIGQFAHDHTRIGLCRFDVITKKNLAETSINLNPHLRGRGLSARLLLAAMQQFLGQHPVTLLAIIRKHNTASIKCFVRCNFELQNEDTLYHYYAFHPTQNQIR